jgi:murein DD-endopeptidase MepM/ murein hydrolase activator NlpD
MNEVKHCFDSDGGRSGVRPRRFPAGTALILMAALRPALCAVAPEAAPLHRTVDLNVNESAQVEFAGGLKATVKLLAVSSTTDSLRDAVREAGVEIEIGGVRTRLSCANYSLPVRAGSVQVDCPLNRSLLANSNRNPWGLVKDARLRLWPAASPYLPPGTFQYPVKQKWFVGDTQMANEPTFQTGDERPSRRAIYYHSGLDIGGAEGMTDVVSATAGLVIARGDDVSRGYEKDTPVSARYDRVYVLDGRGWILLYSHLLSIDPGIRPGERVAMGQKIGVLGKEGTSGGWSHLHFDISARQPSGQWGIEEGYAFLWESYVREYQPALIAVARPHRLAAVGEKVVLDGSKSWSRGRITRYDWTFTDGSRASGAKVERLYKEPGTYHETLKVTDNRGQVAYDFAFVQVLDRPGGSGIAVDQAPPTIHAVYSPTLNLHPGQPITFLVRTFRTTSGSEVWDFGDGAAPVTVKSDGGSDPHAKDGYVRTVHKYQKPGDYLVRVERRNERGERAVARLQVQIR